MASSGKKKTTMAKLTRESRLRERRLDKQARKEARKQASLSQGGDALTTTSAEQAVPDGGPSVVETPAQPIADA